MQKIGKVNEYISFHRLVAEGRFPLNNIAFLLFLDVVRWFSLDRSTSAMRYSDNIKLFWRTGLRLFHGKFLRFMGGPKCTGSIIQEGASHGLAYADNSRVNFIVPDRKLLSDEKKFVTGNRPGILHEMIGTISACDPEQLNTYKLCVDGKKINPSSNGEVQLWGYEDVPTFAEKQNRLQAELGLLESMIKTLTKLISYDHSDITTCDDDDKACILADCRKFVTILSERIKDLRQLKVRKDVFLKKMLEKCETDKDWRDSQFSMVISSIKTSVYRIDNAVSELLSINETLCRYAAFIGGASSFLFQTRFIPLISQGNYVCLGENGSPDCPAFLKQRSEGWHNLRNKSMVTGSKINTALGLDSLKKQKEYLDIKAGRKPDIEISPELQKKFDHGTENEINAIATLAGTFLPAFLPKSLLFEEGCYIVKENERLLMVVSPDGSIRSSEDITKVLCGLEVKCPLPGKLYTTPIHYGIPHYYVTQVLSEMYSLDVKELLFVSYSKESMSVHNIEFDKDLWVTILEEIKRIDLEHIPKKTSPTVPVLKARISEFCKTKVKLIAEIPSCTAVQCNHVQASHGRIFHESRELDESDHFQLSDILKILLMCDRIIRHCHDLCVQRASEVLVFLIADLDRGYKAEIPHAFPIAFAFKGYSMRTDAMRKMIQEMLLSLFHYGMYTPIVSYDGQWAKLAFTNGDGEPLTILELQKKVFAEIQSRSAKELCDKIFQTGIVKGSNFEDLKRTIHVEKKGPRVFVGFKQNQSMFKMSSNAVSYLETCRKQKKRRIDGEQRNDNVDEILSNIPSEELSKVNEDVYEALTCIDDSRATARHMDTDNIERRFLNTDEVNPEIPLSISEEDLALQGGPVDFAHPDLVQRSEGNIIPTDTMHKILDEIQNHNEWGVKWAKKSFYEFNHILINKDLLATQMTKPELLFCYDIYTRIHGSTELRIFKSWNKKKIVDILSEACTSAYISDTTKRQKKLNPASLVLICRKIVRSLPKRVLNVIVAEYEFPEKLMSWQQDSPFQSPTSVNNIGPIRWLTKPEYNPSSMAYIFSVLDIHHLHTNCRVKVCKDGYPERGISKEAWLAVAKENETNLKIAHVQDLVDKQSDAIARLTFSSDVEAAMKRLNYKREANFCRLLREYHEAEDEPGISALDRCRRRLNFRQWLLDGVNFNHFPPYGSYVKGIPNISFQGYLTNIERRMQMFPYVKSGKYNVRSLGSLEAENFFSEFQDLDPKGSGVIKAEEIPAALEAACQMNHTRVMPDRPFHMNLTKAKVYPTKDLLADLGGETKDPYLYPTYVTSISISDHTFDHSSRGKRKARRKLASIAGPDEAAREVAPVRQHHKCDESKILPHKRLGIVID